MAKQVILSTKCARSTSVASSPPSSAVSATCVPHPADGNVAALRKWCGSTSPVRPNTIYRSYQDTMTWLSEIVMATEYRVHWPQWATVPLRREEDVSAKLKDEHDWYKIERCIHIMMDMEKISCGDIDPKIQNLGEALGPIADRIVDEQDELHGFYYNGGCELG